MLPATPPVQPFSAVPPQHHGGHRRQGQRTADQRVARGGLAHQRDSREGGEQSADRISADAYPRDRHTGLIRRLHVATGCSQGKFEWRAADERGEADDGQQDQDHRRYAEHRAGIGLINGGRHLLARLGEDPQCDPAEDDARGESGDDGLEAHHRDA